MNTSFHSGERAVQEQAGVRLKADRVAPSIGRELVPAAREFLGRQPLVFVGFADRGSRLWASVLTGKPGFARALSSQVAVLDAAPAQGDPLWEVWEDGTAVGLLAIEPVSRRRMRVNGTLSSPGDAGTRVAVQQAYANCPKYIQAREWEDVPRLPLLAAQHKHHTQLTQAQQRWIAQSDTFFIASSHPEAGADVSHRGGKPGFVRVENETTLAFPDYAGNNMFNTLGNITANPHAGLLFLDFASGDTLQITGRASIAWTKERTAEFTGAQRVIDFQITETLQVSRAVPLRWHFLEASPFNPQ